MKNPTVRRVLLAVAAVLVVGGLYWFQLPPLNLRSPDFWSFLFEVMAVALVAVVLGRILTGKGTAPEVVMTNHGPRITVSKEGPKFFSGAVRVLVIGLGGVIAVGVIGSLIGAEIFHAGAYKDLIVKEEGNFTDDVAELTMDQIPVVDRDSATKLGSRKLGEMSDLVSQFEIEPYYTQINYHGKPVRVTPLIYGDLFKWFANSGNGVPAYLQVDMVTQETTLTRLDQGMK